MPPRSSMAGFTLLPVILTMTLIAAIAFLLNRDNGMNAGMVAGQSDAERARYTAEAGLQMVNALSQAKNCAGYTDLATTTFGAGSFRATVTPTSGTPVTLTAAATTAEGASASLTRANVMMHQTTPSPPLTLQPGTEGKDTYFSHASPNNNYGASNDLKLNAGSLVSMVQFDLSEIPPGSVVQSALFSLYHTAGGNNPASVFSVTRPWSEGTGAAGSGATWNSYDGVNSWTAAGGDYDPTSGVNITLPANNQWATWDMTTQTAAWVLGNVPNYGIKLVTSSGGSNSFVSSDDATNITQRPKLVVTFLPPCGWVSNAAGVTLPATGDTWISGANTNSNYGTDISFTVTNTAKAGRGLVRFDLSGIPAGKLKSATLRLYVDSFTNPLNSNLTVKQVLAPWTENGADWKTANGNSNSWLCGCWGGYFAPPPAAATAPISNTFTSGWVEWDITALAQEWVDGISPNYGAGVMIDTSSAVIFNSRESTVNQPQLVITW